MAWGDGANVQWESMCGIWSAILKYCHVYSAQVSYWCSDAVKVAVQQHQIWRCRGIQQSKQGDSGQGQLQANVRWNQAASSTVNTLFWDCDGLLSCHTCSCHALRLSSTRTQICIIMYACAILSFILLLSTYTYLTPRTQSCTAAVIYVYGLINCEWE